MLCKIRRENISEAVMKSRWILRAELFVQPGSYTIKLPTGAGKERAIDVMVDENRYFELSEDTPDGILSVARPAST